MERSEITKTLKEIFKMAKGDAAVLTDFDENAVLTTDLGLNSVGVLYMVIGIEEFFSISFDDVSFGDFKTVKDVVDYIVCKLS